MINEDVVVNVCGVQKFGGENDTTEVTVRGNVSADENNGYTIKYTEYLGEDAERNTVITVSHDKTVSVNRFGLYTSELFFEQGRRHRCCYNTPYGALDMSVYTHKIECDLTELGGVIYIEYSLDFGTQESASDNIMTITVTSGQG